MPVPKQKSDAKKPVVETPNAEAFASQVSEAKLAANQSNAQQSTGPKTLEGKARSSQNAVKHGLFAKTLRLTAESYGEERADFDAMLASMRAQYLPAEIEENMIVEKIAANWWLMARLRNQGQRRVAAAIKVGMDLSAAAREAFPYENQEMKLERSVSKLRKELQFLQRLRNGESCKHTRPVAATYEQMVKLHQEEAEATKSRIAAEQKREEDAPTGASPSAATPEPAEAIHATAGQGAAIPAPHRQQVPKRLLARLELPLPGPSDSGRAHQAAGGSGTSPNLSKRTHRQV